MHIKLIYKACVLYCDLIIIDLINCKKIQFRVNHLIIIRSFLFFINIYIVLIIIDITIITNVSIIATSKL